MSDSETAIMVREIASDWPLGKGEWPPNPMGVRSRETYNFVKLQGAAKDAAVEQYRQVGRMMPQLLELPFEWKLAHAEAIILAAMRLNVRTALSWSGGRGSTVMLHLVRQVVKREWESGGGRLSAAVQEQLESGGIPALFANTRVEFPETVRFVRHWAKEWDLLYTETKPIEGWSYRQVVRKKGWPVLGKEASHHSAEYYRNQARRKAREKLEDGPLTLFPLEDLVEMSTSLKAQMRQAVETSSSCCYYLKERPLDLVQREQGITLSFQGIQASESERRRANYIDFGELYYSWFAHFWTSSAN